MEAGGLNEDGTRGPRAAVARERLPDPAALRAPWWEPLRPWVAGVRGGDDRLDLDFLNAASAAAGLVTSGGHPVRFVEGAPPPGVAYETSVWRTGRVPTRAGGRGMLHDWFNALAWLRFPRLKALLNRLQAGAIEAGGIGGCRGPLRDAVTLFDESGALLLTRDPSIGAALRAADWRELFVAGRQRFERAARVVIVGHAVYEKLLAPYAGICARVRVVDCDPGAGWDAIDRAALGSLRNVPPSRETLPPLPLLGVPGWWAANADPAFYEDRRVFRPRTA